VKIKPHKPPFKLKEVKLELTRRCNLDCVHCSSEARPDSSEEMSLEKALKLASEMRELGVGEIAFTGGEPLLWKGITQLAAECARSKAALVLYTSGNVNGFRDTLAELLSHGLSRVVLSLFAGSADRHDEVTRIPGSFEKTISAATEACALNLETEFHFVPMRRNYAELPSVVAVANRLGMKKVSVLRFVPQGRGAINPKMALTRTENIELKNMIAAERRRTEVRTGSPYNFLLLNEDAECNAAIDRLYVGPGYDIYPCDAFKQIAATDIVATDKYSRLDKWSLAECWEFSPYLQAVRRYLMADFPDICDQCPLLERCLSGCLAQKVLVNGDLRKAQDPMCIKS